MESIESAQARLTRARALLSDVSSGAPPEGTSASGSKPMLKVVDAPDTKIERDEPDDSFDDPQERARHICLTQLSHAARTRAHLESVLAKRGIADDIAAEVLDRLEVVGLVNDAEFAHAWVRSRQRSKGLSRRLLATELQRAGVARELIDEALAHVADEDETAAAMELAAKRAHALQGVEPDVAMRRIAALLARKGYPPGVCFDAARAAVAATRKDS